MSIQLTKERRRELAVLIVKDYSLHYLSIQDRRWMKNRAKVLGVPEDDFTIFMGNLIVYAFNNAGGCLENKTSLSVVREGELALVALENILKDEGLKISKETVESMEKLAKRINVPLDEVRALIIPMLENLFRKTFNL